MKTRLLIMIVVCAGIVSGTGIIFLIEYTISPLNQNIKQGDALFCPKDMIMVDTDCIKVNLDNEFNLTPDILREQGFTGYRIVQILNCDATDTERGVRMNGITNATHQFDQLTCTWKSLESKLNLDTTP